MDAALRNKWLEMAVREVCAQCTLGLAAYGLMAIGMRNSTDQVFTSIQALLSHTANVSKMLKAPQCPLDRRTVLYERTLQWLFRRIGRRRIADQGPNIGDMLSVENHSLVHREGRKFRNNLEHYDERLLRWLRKTGPQVFIIDFNVMPKNSVRVGANSIVVRNLDPSNHVFTFADRDLKLISLVDELRRIKEIADHWVRENTR